MPLLSDYQTSLQNPATCFTDPDLQRSKVDTNPMGLPRAISGGFAITFRLRGSGDWAVRCFHRDVPELQSKYQAISAKLKTLQSPLFERFDYQQNGVRLTTGTYPIIKMGWLTGQTLGLYVDDNIRKPQLIDALADRWLKAIAELERLQVAHGDLQHGNVMVLGSGELKFIDYDGIYVPGMAIGKGHEKGHVNYQHPQRDGIHYGPDMDRFSAIVIYVSLKAIAKKPDLWDRYHTGENLIIAAKDFVDPDGSPVFREMAQLSGDAAFKNIAKLCRVPIEKVPRLEEFLSKGVPEGAVMAALPVAPRSLRQYEALGGEYHRKILDREGRIIEVVGKVTAVRQAHTRHGKPYAFVNFGNWQDGCFTIVIWSEGLKLLTGTAFSDPSSLTGKWVSITGLVQKYSSYKARGATSPQIVLDHPSQMRLLKGGKADADAILAERWDPNTAPATTSGGSNAEILGGLSSGGGRSPRSPVSPTGPNPVHETDNQALLRKLGGSKQPPGGPPPTTPTNRTTPPKTSNDSCFIATAAFGSPEEAEVLALRRWRDDVLLESGLGRLAVGVYYRTSPPIARWVRRKETRRQLIRSCLKPLVKLLCEREER